MRIKRKHWAEMDIPPCRCYSRPAIRNSSHVNDAVLVAVLLTWVSVNLDPECKDMSGSSIGLVIRILD